VITKETDVKKDRTRLSPEQLRWRVDEHALPFSSTEEVDPAKGIVGQPIAREAMRFGVECDAPGQNVYVRGLSGTGRMTMVHSLLNELKPQARRKLDRCYVHSFSQPDRPRLITLKAGQGCVLRRMMKEPADFIQHRMGEALNTETMKARREAIKQQTQEKIQEITQPLESELQENGLAMVQIQTGPYTQTTIFPVKDGKPVSPEQFNKLISEGKADKSELEQVEEKIDRYGKKLAEVTENASHVYQSGLEGIQQVIEDEARNILDNLTADIVRTMDNEAVTTFISEVTEDVIENRIQGNPENELPDPHAVYGVNVIRSHEDEDQGPVIVENSPTVHNLLGTVETQFNPGGQSVTNYQGIRAGSLVLADGGFLVLDAHDVLTEPGAWRILMRSLRTGSVEIVPNEIGWPFVSHSLKPEPIDISVRVIMIGSGGLYYQLDQFDQDFSDLFKVLADFDSEIERSDEGVAQYAGVLARLSQEENLLPFSAGGVAALAEHGARIAARKGKISARFGRLADIVREASFIAAKAGSRLVDRQHVEETTARTRFRASLPARRYQELISDATIGLATEGAVVGQMNGLAVIQTGPLSYGFPARLTATIGAGQAGVINIEGESALSGAIHTKGFYILGGLLRHLLRTEHPLAFSASIAFEQSYGGIDGDSASGAEVCCLLSALTDVPIHQGIAMTGAIDQLGRIQAIGGVNEKIEGFFDACTTMGLSGEQGVVIPATNAGDLMLREDVVRACEAGQFHVYAVAHISEALEILTGMPAGEIDEHGKYPEGSLLNLAQTRASEFWRRTLSQPEKEEKE
jgi:ATP-dependent Lon protease